MVVRQTTNCQRHGHPEFSITYDPKIVPVEGDVNTFLTWLEESVSQGTQYLPGQTCQLGWGVLEIRLRADGFLTLWEPNMPFVWEESIGKTLSHLRLQKDVVESVLSNSDLSFPSMVQFAIICNRLGRNQDILMERGDCSGRDSGWYCGCRDPDHDHNDADELQCVSLYEASIRSASQIIPYLALPMGTLVNLISGMPTILCNGENLAFKSGSLLSDASTKTVSAV